MRGSEHWERMGEMRNIQGVAEGKVNIMRGHSIGHSKQKSVYLHMSYSERFPR
jgi:hypothetical protein